MTDINPYAATAETSLEPEATLPVSNRQLWVAYLAAPIVPPALITLVFMVLGTIGLITSGPNATGTPAGIIIVPIMLMTVGSMISYLVALVFGMPAIFWLRRRKRLNGITIHLTAAMVGVLFMALMLLVGSSTGQNLTLSEVAAAMFGGTLILTPFALPGGTTFWWMTCRRRRLNNYA